MDQNLVKSIEEYVSMHPGIALLEAEESDELLGRASQKFGFDRTKRWWWQASGAAMTLPYGEDDGLKALLQVLPPSDHLRLFVTDDELPPWPCLAAPIGQLSDFLQTQRFFEYFIVPQTIDWAIFDTHHNALVAFGNPALFPT